jgi:hypothetical protein
VAILTEIPGVDFDAAWTRRLEAVWDEGRIFRRVAAKRAGRRRDLADIEAIEKAADARE